MAEINLRVTGLESIKPLLAATDAVAKQWESMHSCYSSTAEGVVLADLLDALAGAVSAARESRTGELPPCPHGNDLASECTDGCRP